MLFLPPGSAKSTYASILTPPHYLARNPRNLVIGASHTAELAERFGRKVRNIVADPGYEMVTGLTLAGDSKAAGRWETSAGGEYFAVGVGGSVTGRRADLALIDDPIKGRADADSETIREKTWEWYLADLRTRLKPEAAIVLIQTRWHEDDLAGRILPENFDFRSGPVEARDGEVWDVLCLPALAERDDDPLGRQAGESIWPEWFSVAMLNQERVTQGPRNWSALYQQRPAPEEGDFFKREWFRWYDTPPARGTLQIYGASDYAVTADGGDYTVHGLFGVDPNDDIYVLDWWRKQTGPEEWIEALLDLANHWKPLDWAEESGQILKSVGPFLEKRMRERRVYFHRRQFASSADKPTRAQSIRGRAQMGKIYLPRHAEWAEPLLRVLLTFPAGAVDDDVDVLSLLGRMLDRLVAGREPPGPPPPLTTMDDVTLDLLWRQQGKKTKAGMI